MGGQARKRQQDRQQKAENQRFLYGKTSHCFIVPENALKIMFNDYSRETAFLQRFYE
jgi:hypothetical protein